MWVSAKVLREGVRGSETDGFWASGDFNTQNACICGCIKVVEIKRRYTAKGAASRRSNSRLRARFRVRCLLISRTEAAIVQAAANQTRVHAIARDLTRAMGTGCWFTPF